MPREIISEQKIQYPPEDKDAIDDAYSICIFPEEPSVDLEKWKFYLNDNLILDSASLDTIPPGRYTVFVRFVVGEKGKLSNISILKDPGYGLGERVIIALANCSGIWKPIIDEKDQVRRNYMTQPITFIVEESCDKLPATFTL